MLSLFPEIRPYHEGRLPVSDGHTLFYEQSGDPHGLPVIVLHGGPGAGCQPMQRRFFDPRHYRIILFDQRGSGRSTPHASVTNNTTADLLNDIEALREHLKLENMVLFGGSFGSTQALLYAQRHPDRVAGIITRGVYLARQCDIDWYFGGGAAQIFPDAYAEFARHIPEDERHDVIAAYHRRLQGQDEIARLAAARAWGQFAARMRSLNDNNHMREQYMDPHRALSVARIANHYVTHQYFLKPNEVLDNAEKLGNIPGILVHGRYDIVSPLAAAWELQKRWPGSELQIIRGAGHVASEAPTVDALIRAGREMYRQLMKTLPDAAD